ncbi:hypothetical protein GCM10023160_16180 [Brachybacterium paraconglomeratum]|uniref:hypothetical protein n=1 Tax=Brachybacterium paraconglomeratum TaxID=173362 RepID=UPI0031E996DE
MAREKNRGGRERLGFLGRIVAYRLQSNVYALLALSVLTGVFILLYLDSSKSSGFSANLWLAISTSLMASVLVLAAETFVKFRQHQNDLFLEGISKLGISNLHFDRAGLLNELLESCDRAFWAVGYRHILTRSLVQQVEAVADRGVSIRLLIVPPWTESFRLVYGGHERVADNYVAIFNAMVHGRGSASMDDIEVRFVNQPLFNDTYKVDDKIVTGPYMHNRDRDHGKITANQFFTYELHRSSRLHEMVLGEFETLWDMAEQKLDWSQYISTMEKLRVEDLNEAGRLELLSAACVPVRGSVPAVDAADDALRA